MGLYKIADLNVKINPEYQTTLNRLKPYLSDEKTADLELVVTKAEIQCFANTSPVACNLEEAEGIVIFNLLCKKILEDFDGFFFHSSSLVMDNEAYIFTAASGTGKSTHTSLWRKRYGSRVEMINDDKPIIRKHDGRFYIYGTPWMGKSEIGNNIKAPIKAVFVLERDSRNSVERVPVADVFAELLKATLVFSEKNNMAKLLSLFDEFFSSTQLYRLKCNTDISAAEAAYNAVNSAKE